MEVIFNGIELLLFDSGTCKKQSSTNIGILGLLLVLLVASSFMSPLEARNGTPANRVRMFNKEHLTKPAVNEKWDQLKIVCTQPFNKNVQYGLSFVTIHSPEIEEESSSHTTLGRFTVEEDNEIIPVGSLFAKRKESKEPTLTAAAAIRKASQPSSFGGDDVERTKIVDSGGNNGGETSSSSSSSKKTRTKPTEKEHSRADESRQRDIHKAKKPETDLKVKPQTSKDKDIPSSKKEKPQKRASKRDSPQPKKKPKTSRKPFEKLLDGVVFVLSGYQNPLRATLRDKATEMGARYKPDWMSGCTHLVCAFPNTPKFQQVRGKGHIVNQKWISECHSQRKRLPWRRFALDRADQGRDESEEEICEEVGGRATVESEDEDLRGMIDDQRGCESGSGTDEDIERVKLESLRELEAKKELDAKRESDAKRKLEERESEAKRKLEESESEAKTKSEDVAKSEIEDDPYGGDTDVDSDHEGLKENRPDTTNLPLPYLPDFYTGKTFYIHPELDSDARKNLSRYIVAFKGSIASNMSAQVNYILAESAADIKTIKTENPKCIAVTPAWVWRCNDEEKLLPTTTFEI